MKQSRFSAEQMTKILEEAKPYGAAVEVARKHGITKATLYAWRKKFGDMPATDVRRMRELEQENSKLKRVVADLTLDNLGLKEIASKKW